MFTVTYSVWCLLSCSYQNTQMLPLSLLRIDIADEWQRLSNTLEDP